MRPIFFQVYTLRASPAMNVVETDFLGFAGNVWNAQTLICAPPVTWRMLMTKTICS